VQRQYDLNRRDSALKQFLDLAIRRVVEPLQRAKDPQLPPRPGPRPGSSPGAQSGPGSSPGPGARSGPGSGAGPGSGPRR
jgi:hypothetical protein